MTPSGVFTSYWMTAFCLAAFSGRKYVFMDPATLLTAAALRPVRDSLIWSSLFPAIALARPARSSMLDKSNAIAFFPRGVVEGCAGHARTVNPAKLQNG